VVASGKGCKAANRYSMNLDALQSKPTSNRATIAPFNADSDSEWGNHCTSNRATIALGIGQPLPTERTEKEHKKEQAGNSPNSLASSKRSAKKPKRETDSNLTTVCVEWNAWHSAGIVRQKIRDTNSPGKTIVDAWNRSQRDPEQRERLKVSIPARKRRTIPVRIVAVRWLRSGIWEESVRG